jgi:hypothetical protein
VARHGVASGPLTIELAARDEGTANQGVLDYASRRARAELHVRLSFPQFAEVLGDLGVDPALSKPVHAVLRLSSIVGDSRTGRVRQFNHVHQLMKLFPQNVLPVIPADPAAPVDLIATDWAIPALAHLFGERFIAGDVAQICAGRDASLTVRELIDLTKRAYERHPLGRQWQPIRMPDFATLSEFETYVERHRRKKDRLFSELLRILSYFLPHLGIYQAFDNRLTLESLANSGLQLPPIRDYYERILAYGLDTGGGKHPPAYQPASA